MKMSSSSEHQMASAMSLAIALAFAGGYADAGSFVTVGAFTGHVTGNTVLAAVAIARRDWHGALLKAMAVGLFLMTTYVGLRFSDVLKVKKHALETAIALQILLVGIAPVFVLLHKPYGAELMIACLCSALGLQNGSFSKADGVSIHTTYLTGDLTKLMVALANRSEPLKADQTTANRRTLRMTCMVGSAFGVGALSGGLGVIWKGPATLWFLEVPLVIAVALAGRRDH